MSQVVTKAQMYKMHRVETHMAMKAIGFHLQNNEYCLLTTGKRAVGFSDITLEDVEKEILREKTKTNPFNEDLATVNFSIFKPQSAQVIYGYVTLRTVADVIYIKGLQEGSVKNLAAHYDIGL